MNKKLFFIASVILMSAGWALFQWHVSGNAPVVRYRTVPVERGDIAQRISVNGTLNPMRVISVGTQVSGTIYKMYADYNQKVVKGQILAEIEPSLLISQVDQKKAILAAARAKYDLSEKTYQRTKALLAKDYVARQDLDGAQQDLENSRAQMTQAAAEVKQAQVNLDYAVIRSPISGVVIARDVDLGQTVAASFQTPELFKIAENLKKMQINAIVSEADIGTIKVGMPTTFTVDAFPNRVFNGIISQMRLDPNNQQNIVTYNVLIDITNDDESLLPGMTALINIQLQQKKDVLIVPNAALRFRPSETGENIEVSPSPSQRYIYVWDGEHVHPVPVSLGVSDGQSTEIQSSEVKQGDRVILEAIAQQ